MAEEDQQTTGQVQSALESHEEEENGDDDEARMTVWEHIDELRSVLIYSTIYGVIGIAGVAVFARRLYQVIIAPLESLQDQTQLYTYSPPEAFVIYLKISLIGGLILASPFILWQALKFILPGLKPSEKRWILPVFLVGFLLFSTGVIFGHYLVIPLALDFLWEFNKYWGLEPLWRVGNYINFVLALYAVFGIFFEMPLVVTIFARLGVASPEFLRQKRKYAIISLVAGSAILTPPDVITQVLLAIPLWILYEISILMAVLVYPHERP